MTYNVLCETLNMQPTSSIVNWGWLFGISHIDKVAVHWNLLLVISVTVYSLPCACSQVDLDGPMYLTDECRTESELGNWRTSQTAVWKHHGGCYWKVFSWVSFSAGWAFFESNTFCSCRINRIQDRSIEMLIWNRYCDVTAEWTMVIDSDTIVLLCQYSQQ